MNSFPDFSLENEIADNFYLSPVVDHNDELVVAGCDEAGRGPLCGPVVAAAVVFMRHSMPPPQMINDSKKMTRAQRDAAYNFITDNPNIIWATGQCSPAEIDELNILRASLTAMQRAISALARRPDFVLVDGNRLPDNLIRAPLRDNDISSLALFDYISKMSGNTIMGRAVIRGDSKSLSIAAASIVAKVTRDRIMCELHRRFPQYGWHKNVGYPTAAHLQAIKEYGISEYHRKTFAPVARIISQ